MISCSRYLLFPGLTEVSVTFDAVGWPDSSREITQMLKHFGCSWQLCQPFQLLWQNANHHLDEPLEIYLVEIAGGVGELWKWSKFLCHKSDLYSIVSELEKCLAAPIIIIVEGGKTLSWRFEADLFSRCVISRHPVLPPLAKHDLHSVVFTQAHEKNFSMCVSSHPLSLVFWGCFLLFQTVFTPNKPRCIFLGTGARSTLSGVSVPLCSCSHLGKQTEPKHKALLVCERTLSMPFLWYYNDRVDCRCIKPGSSPALTSAVCW